MAGQRQPIELVIAKGKKHLTKKEIEERKNKEIKAPTGNIKPPSYLDADLKKEFKVISEQLIDIGILADIDNEALARYLISKKLYIKVTKSLLKMSPTIEDDGETYQNNQYAELSKTQDRLFKQCRTAALDLGLTISSRCKLVLPKKEEKQTQSKWARFGG